MVQSTKAIFENGAFKPLEPIQGIPEHALVKISVETLVPHSRQEQLVLLAAVPVAEELATAIEEERTHPWPVSEF
jgi:predicted DNA-binding antitoxin AbrB/MazE fold protein